jgi:Tol biopolymer transport system component
LTIRPAGASIAFDRLTNGNGASVRPKMSADGRTVVFGSYATDLPHSSPAGGGGAQGMGLFVMNQLNGTITRLSRDQSAPSSAHPWSISWDGTYVAFESDAPSVDHDPDSADDNGVSDIFVSGGGRITDGNGPSTGPSLAPAGLACNCVAFTSEASDLVPGDTNGIADVFLATWNPDSITRLSGDDGGSNVSLSADAGFATYDVPAGLQLLDIGTGARTLISNGQASSSDVSMFGDEVVFQTGAGVQLWTRSTGQTQIIGPATGSPPVISDDGAFVAYEVRSGGGGVPVRSNINRWDTATGTAQPITSGPGISTNPVFNGVGSIMSFQSDTTGLVPNDANGMTDVFVWRQPT